MVLISVNITHTMYSILLTIVQYRTLRYGIVWCNTVPYRYGKVCVHQYGTGTERYRTQNLEILERREAAPI